ncbi:hypothetical protein [Pseudonocardia pini]|nr:hypothetical protein [Pseudonocardia pini]
MDDDWGTLIWLVMTTGIRRGELLREDREQVSERLQALGTHLTDKTFT